MWASLVRRAWGSVARAQGAWPAAPVSLPADRLARRLERLPADERAAVRAVLEEAIGPRHRAVLESAAAAGHAPDTLARFVDLVGATPEADLPGLLDPLPRHLRQRSQTTCGSASLLVARALADPVYALWLLEGVDARTGAASRTSVADRFASAERTVKDRTNAVLGPAGLQPPWPHPLGTPPWGAAAEMTRIVDEPYRSRYVDPDSPASRRAAYDAVVRVAAAGHAVPMFVGNAAAPRHVVLAVDRDDDALRLYEPASGDVVRLRRDHYVDGGFRVAGWTVPWAVVVPR